MKKSINYIYRTIAIAALVIIAISPGKARAAKIDPVRLDSRINELIEKNNIPDADVAVIRNDSVIYRFSKNAVNAGRNYLIGSCSKSFTALSVMILAEKGKIDIDKPVQKYIPWFEIKDTQKTERITVRHLLNQTSGIGNHYGFFDYPTGDFSLYRAKLVEHLRQIELLNEPGEAFCYSNLNYLLLGLIVEAVTKEKYTEFLSEDVFAKIGMKMSFGGFNDDLLTNTLQAYQYLIFNKPHKTKIYPHSDYVAAYGYLSSNVADLCNYLNFIINRGVTREGDTLIAADSYNTLLTPVKGNYAMGWISLLYNNKKMLIHSGLDENYSAILEVCPEDRLGIIVLSNINNLQFCSMVQASVMDMLENKPFHNQFSLELIFRWVPGSLAVLALALFLYNLYRWKKYSLKVGFIFKPLSFLRLIFGIGLSVAGILLVQKYYTISIFSVFNYQPDIVMSFISIFVFGILSSFTRYFGTYSKTF